jgi:hypothetical protein
LRKENSPADQDNLPDPCSLANAIIEDIEAALASFIAMMETINEKPEEKRKSGCVNAKQLILWYCATSG